MFRIKRDQRGDTIVEVLIAIAVITSVLGLVYSTMNRNFKLMRGNQERTEASKTAQGQLEALKGLYSADPDAVTDNGLNGFCINGGVTVAPPGKPAPTLGGDDLSTYGACTSSHYRYVLKRDATDTKLYTATVRWEAFGSGRSEVIMYYRIQ
ncbi:MAG: type II secretion system protein [Candidatus Saccharimonadales bacterium]